MKRWLASGPWLGSGGSRRGGVRWKRPRGAWSSGRLPPNPRACTSTRALALRVRGGAAGGAVGAAMEVPNVKDFQWKRLAPLPSRRVYCSLLETGGQVYAIGGCDDNGVPMDCFEVYSPEADQWTALPPLPTARAGVAVIALGKRIMVIGGVGTNQLPMKVVEMYNIDEGKWKKRSVLREAAMGISVTAKGERGQA